MCMNLDRVGEGYSPARRSLTLSWNRDGRKMQSEKSRLSIIEV